MYRLIFIAGLMLLVNSVSRAQQQVDFNTFNTETYRLYLAEEWDSLIVMGKTGLKQDKDFYYLRMRMGIAYYQKKNFRMAATHYRKALKLNDGEPAAQEQLYYAYLLSGQREEARLIRKQFKGDLGLSLPPPKGAFADRITGNYLYSWGLTSDLLSDTDELFSGLPSGVQYLPRHFYYASLGLVNSIAPGVTLTHSLNFLSKINHLHYYDGINHAELSDQHVYQYQYYVSPGITTTTGFTFMPMFHLVSVHYEFPVQFGQGFMGNNAGVVTDVIDETDFVAGLGMKKRAGMFDLHLGFWYATLNNSEQFQNRLGVTWYPLGNLNLYAGGYINSQYETAESDSSVRFIPELHVGFAIANKVWVDLNGAMGIMTQYLEQNGMIIYNSFSDQIRKKIILSVSAPVTKKGSLLYLGGRWTDSQSEFFPSITDQNNITNTIHYQTFSIYGGITWKF